MLLRLCQWRWQPVLGLTWLLAYSFSVSTCRTPTPSLSSLRCSHRWHTRSFRPMLSTTLSTDCGVPALTPLSTPWGRSQLSTLHPHMHTHTCHTHPRSRLFDMLSSLFCAALPRTRCALAPLHSPPGRPLRHANSHERPPLPTPFTVLRPWSTTTFDTHLAWAETTSHHNAR